MVYRFSEERNTTDALTDKKLDELYYILSIDLGYHDATAFTVGGFHDSDPNFYLVDGFKRVGMLVSGIAEKIREFQKRYEFTKIVADTGGLGKMVVEEIVQRYGIPIEPAEKKSKNDFIELCNSDLELGRVKILKNVEELKELRSQLSVLQWDEKRKKEDPRQSNDYADSFLYNWREAKHYAAEEPLKPIGQDDAEWGDEQERRELERAHRRRDTSWNEFEEDAY
jgi:hypothetical protein